MAFQYGTEHRANQAICRLFDKGLIDTLDILVKQNESGKFEIQTLTKHDDVNVFAI